ncbi:hypothetical protein [Clostridium kluyveri]|uniref:hypothetical protein n=1 Tax=Clostridium kluyveri TaxID=1534 RepID=UPI00224738B4|nr:hypothetical protein [Clostridium kluyveri]UZQ49808.1 hypothetical protein OP486_17955 [Clostridium kluyveri]
MTNPRKIKIGVFAGTQVTRRELAQTIIQELCYPHENIDYYTDNLGNLPLDEYSEKLKSMERPCRRKRR